MRNWSKYRLNSINSPSQATLPSPQRSRLEQSSSKTHALARLLSRLHLHKTSNQMSISLAMQYQLLSMDSQPFQTSARLLTSVLKSQGKTYNKLNWIALISIWEEVLPTSLVLVVLSRSLQVQQTMNQVKSPQAPMKSTLKAVLTTLIAVLRTQQP